MADAPIKLIQLQISTEKKIWERCLVQSYVPPLEDLTFYYTKLLAFSDAKVTIHVEDIPHDFNIALLPKHDSAPSDFPANDLETAPKETDRRAKYTQFLTQLCEMERSRAALREFHRGAARSAAAAKQKYTSALTDEPLYLVGYASENQGAGQRRAWVSEVLKDLDAEEEYDGEDVLITDDEVPPLGWIVSPTISSARAALGSRFVLDAATGRKWERLLGTDMYPDLIFVRRITTKGWTFASPLSDSLLQNVLTWFLKSQDLEVADGMTQFCVRTEKEFGKLVSALRNVKVGERLLDMSDDTNPRVKMAKMLDHMETHLLESADEHNDIQPISENVFYRYLSYAFRAKGVPRDVYAADEKLPNLLERWAKSNYGFKPNVDPLVAEWKEVWDYVMRGKPTAIRVNHFLASMDAWDPVACSTITNTDRSAIAQEWIKIYLDTQLVRCESGKIKSVILHDQTKKWCLRFIPESVFSSSLSATIIGPVLTKRGLISVKEKNGRYIAGIKFRNLVGKAEDHGGETTATDAEIRAASEETVTEANSVQYTSVSREHEDGSKTKQRTVTQTLVAEKDGARIEHFFTASVTTETIHLGSM